MEILFILQHALNDVEQAFKNGIGGFFFAFEQLEDVFLRLGIGISKAKASLEADRKAAAALEQENAVLEEDIEDLGTIRSIKDLARRFLGLFDPDTIIFSPED